MTMLDRMRRHQYWLKWSLAVVCLAFILLYVPSFLRDTGAGAASTDVVARVDSHDITAGEFRRLYQRQVQTYRSYGSNMSEQLLKQLGIDRQVLQQMVEERAALDEAERLDLRASDEEVKQRISAMPVFQDNGQFVGEQRYLQVLRMQRPPLSPADFEEDVRRDLTVEKLRTAITAWLSVPDQELEQEYRRRNDKIKLALVSFTADKFRKDVSATDTEVAAYFDGHKSDFKIPEKRKIRYLVVDVDAVRASITIPPAEVERLYNSNIEQYTTQEQVRASHILFKTEGKNEEEVKSKAEEVLKQVKAGADFAELARKDSEDEASAKKGGDLDYFGRGRMVPEFDQVAFSMKPGETSDLVKSQFGYHIIKLVDKKPAVTRPLADVRQQISDQLAYERAQTQASDLAQALQKEISKPSDLDRVSRSQGAQRMPVQESGFFARDEPVLGLGSSLEASARAFDMKQGEVAGPIRTGRGFAFLALVARQDAYVPKLDEVKERVREEVIKQKAKEASAQKAADVAGALQRAADFEKAAKAAGLEPKTTDLIARGAALPDLGVAPAVEKAAFALPAGAVSDPIATDNGTAVVKVVEKKEVTPSEWQDAKDRFREEVLNERRTRFFNAYMAKAKQRMKIEIYREAVQKVVG